MCSSDLVVGTNFAVVIAVDGFDKLAVVYNAVAVIIVEVRQ